MRRVNEVRVGRAEIARKFVEGFAPDRRQFHQHCLALLAESKGAKEIVDQTRTKPQGTVRISCPVALLSSGIAEIISRYPHDNPQVQVLVDATNRRVDVIEEGLDFAIRVRLPPLEDTDLAVRQLGLSTLVLVASPDLVERHAAPTSIESLRDWPTLCIANNSERYIWNLVDTSGQVVSLAHQPRLATDDLASLRIAAMRGVGVAMLPRELLDADLQSGRLRAGQCEHRIGDGGQSRTQPFVAVPTPSNQAGCSSGIRCRPLRR